MVFGTSNLGMNLSLSYSPLIFPFFAIFSIPQLPLYFPINKTIDLENYLISMLLCHDHDTYVYTMFMKCAYI